MRWKKRKLPINVGMAYALLSRLGRLRHCNSKKIYALYVPNGLQKALKNIVRDYQKGDLVEWNMLLDRFKEEISAA